MKIHWPLETDNHPCRICTSRQGVASGSKISYEVQVVPHNCMCTFVGEILDLKVLGRFSQDRIMSRFSGRAVYSKLEQPLASTKTHTQNRIIEPFLWLAEDVDPHRICLRSCGVIQSFTTFFARFHESSTAIVLGGSIYSYTERRFFNVRIKFACNGGRCWRPPPRVLPVVL